MSIPEEKHIPRKELLDKRLSLSPEATKKFSEKILNRLSNKLTWNDIANMYVYHAIKKEVDTKDFLKWLKMMHPDINVEIAPTKSSAPTVPEGKDYDVIIVPVVGFDRRGYRLGYGGGYYDKFLSKNNCRLVVGLAYSFSELKKIPNESHDEKMDMIITEKEIIRIKD